MTLVEVKKKDYYIVCVIWAKPIILYHFMLITMSRLSHFVYAGFSLAHHLIFTHHKRG